MKSTFRTLLASILAFCVLVGAALQGFSQTTVQVDSTKSWVGWMNVYDYIDGNPGAYMWGQAWGTAALTAYFNGTNSVTIMPNTNVWNPLDPYWVNTNTIPYSGAKWMEANFYVDVGTALQGQTVTFVGDVITNDLQWPYYCQAFIKEFAPGYSYVGMTTGELYSDFPFTVTRDIAAGNICQYGFITTGPNADPATMASLGSVVVAVNNEDPSLSSVASQALGEGQTANFTVVAQGTAPLYYQWTQITPAETNVLTDGGRISGATTNQLTIASVVEADAGTYSVTVTNSKGSATATALLTVVPLAQAATNYLLDPGFEQSFLASSSDAGWYPFNGAVKQNTNNFYYLSATPVTVVDGTNCVQTYSTGNDTWNGFFQDRPALPGEVYTASCWFLTPTEDPITGSNVCFLEVQFRNAADVPLVQYASAMIDSTFPTSTWFKLTPTNIHDGVNFTNSVGTSSYLVAPPGTAKVRFQVTYHGLDGTGSVYADAAQLILEEPVVTAVLSGGQIQLSFSTVYGPKYQVYYATSLTTPNWQTLGSPITGDGSIQTVSDSIGATPRFYTVNTQ